MMYLTTRLNGFPATVIGLMNIKGDQEVKCIFNRLLKTTGRRVVIKLWKASRTDMNVLYPVQALRAAAYLPYRFGDLKLFKVIAM